MNPQLLHSPMQFELIRPLLKWKILSLDHLMEATWKIDKTSNFYKTIEGLENKGLLEAFHDPYSKNKYVYLTNFGYQSLVVKNLIPINKETILHESYSTENAFHYMNFPFTNEVLMDHEILEQFPMIGHRPDAMVQGHHKKDFCLAMEMELSIKSNDRILEAFTYYSQSNFFNNVLYIFGQEQVYDTYVRVLENEGKNLETSKFLFQLMPNMYRRKYDTFNSKCYHNGQLTTLGKLFGMDEYYEKHGMKNLKTSSDNCSGIQV